MVLYIGLPLFLFAANLAIASVQGFAYFLAPIILSAISLVFLVLIMGEKTFLANAGLALVITVIPSIFGLFAGLLLRHIRKPRERL